MDVDDSAFGLSIGALARATGIPANTLRTWERRYEFPRPKRTSGGQRLYDPEVVEHLRLVAHALEHGHRPAQVLKLSPSVLRDLVGHPPPVPVPPLRLRTEVDWVDLVLALDDAGLDSAFACAWSRLGGLGFVADRVVPFLARLREAGAGREACVFHEHLASERLKGFLGGQWRALSDRSTGPIAVLSTLPGDRSDVTLHLAGTVFALVGWRVVFLGMGTPLSDVAAAARTAVAAAVGVSGGLDGADLRSLRDLLDPTTELVVSGAGEEVPGTVFLPDLRALAGWASARV